MTKQHAAEAMLKMLYNTYAVHNSASSNNMIATLSTLLYRLMMGEL